MNKKERRAFIALWENAVDFLIETGGCDHSVGICYCPLVYAVEDGFEVLEAYLKKIESTPENHPRYTDIETEHTSLAFVVSSARNALSPKVRNKNERSVNKLTVRF